MQSNLIPRYPPPQPLPYRYPYYHAWRVFEQERARVVRVSFIAAATSERAGMESGHLSRQGHVHEATVQTVRYSLYGVAQRR